MEAILNVHPHLLPYVATTFGASVYIRSWMWSVDEGQQRPTSDAEWSFYGAFLTACGE